MSSICNNYFFSYFNKYESLFATEYSIFVFYYFKDTTTKMRINSTTLLMVILLLFLPGRALGVPAYPYPVSIKQPDGTSLTVVLKGDEFHHYFTTEDGYLIAKDKNGVFNYARKGEHGRKITTRVKANNISTRLPQERNFIKTLERNPDFSKERLIARQKRAPAVKSSAGTFARFPRTGSPRSLVILVNFSNLSFITPDPQVAFTNLLNEEGYSLNGATGSARDYFRDNSMGAFTPIFDVVGPYTLPKPYEFYGKNDLDGYDENPVQMIIDACKAAHDDGIDFSIYDTENDGLIDNVFVYYAGHNEAENYEENTIWPHRWEVMPGINYNGTEESITFDGKRIMDYACTSELRGKSGTEMAGIGTFTHEFGHVIGLVDMYPTDGAEHHTLSKWDIMDDGVYLNEGRTPPSYNSFERFSLGYLKPIVLNEPLEVEELIHLAESNTAYLITNTSNFRLYPQNTNEYFLLENRQQTGWDAFLPGHGLIAYRINYDATDWEYNSPNNEPDKMGVEIIPADNIRSIGTLAGDPYPGTSKNNILIPKSRDGNYWETQPVLGITEKDSIISFKYKGGHLSPPKVSEATDITYGSFKASWEAIDGIAGYYLSVSAIENDGTHTPVITDQWVDSTNLVVNNLVSDKEYVYTVRGSYKNEIPPFEIKTDNSSELVVKTLKYPFEKELRVAPQTNGDVLIFAPESEVSTGVVNVYDVLGRRLRTVSVESDITTLRDLPKNIVLIIQSGKQRTKVIIK